MTSSGGYEVDRLCHNHDTTSDAHYRKKQFLAMKKQCSILRDGTRMHQGQQKNGWKTLGAICICHDLHWNKAQICTSEEHRCCNTRLSRQTEQC